MATGRPRGEGMGIMGFKTAIAAAMAVLGVASASHAAVNIVTNGDFSAGNTGFTSAYAYDAYANTPPNGLYLEGHYTVGSDPAAVHNSWYPLTDGNPRLLVNGSTNMADPTIWQEALTTVAGQSYNFSAQAANICCNGDYQGPNDASRLLFQVSYNGGATYQLLAALQTNPPGDAGQFGTVTASFTATGASTLVRIIDDFNAPGGNDFAIDNISVSATPEPGTWALMIAGVGLAGFALRRRERGLAAA